MTRYYLIRDWYRTPKADDAAVYEDIWGQYVLSEDDAKAYDDASRAPGGVYRRGSNYDKVFPFCGVHRSLRIDTKSCHNCSIEHRLRALETKLDAALAKVDALMDALQALRAHDAAGLVVAR